MEDWTIRIILAAVPIVGSGIIAGVIYNQMRSNKKVESANLIHRLREPWNDKEFGKIFDKYDDADAEYDEDNIKWFLKCMERVALYWKDDSLNENHVKEVFYSDVKYITKKNAIKNHMDAARKRDSMFYSNLDELIEKAKKWTD